MSVDTDAQQSVFRCDFPSCDKTFTRKDHLLRHAANHTAVNHYCPTCRRAFKRVDLLHRHVKRNICGPGPISPNRSKRGRSEGSDELDTSPPSTAGYASGQGREGYRPDSREEGGGGGMYSGPPSGLLSTPGHRLGHAQPVPGGGTRGGRGPGGGVDNKSPSSTSSIPPPIAPHSAPLTRNGLSGIAFPSWTSPSTDSSISPSAPFSAPAMPTPSIPGPSSGIHLSHAQMNNQSMPQFSLQNGISYGHLTNPNSDHPIPHPVQPTHPGPTRTDSYPHTLPDFEVSPAQNWGLNPWQPDPWDALLHDTLAPPFNEPALTLDLPLPWSVPTPTRMQESAERGNDMFASAGLLSKIQSAIPELDVGLPFLTEALARYWTDVSPTFPFIHRGTFDLNSAPSELVVMMAIVGSVHLPDRSKIPDMKKVVQRIRGTLVQDCGLEMPITTLQAFCLCHVFDTWYGTSESLFVAQCMWPIMVAHSRKKGIGVVGKSENEAQEEEAWTAWAQDEERRRAAFCVLLIDTQLSAFWNQHPSRQLSIFAHNIALPCPRSEWEALTAADWARNRAPPPVSPSTSRRSKSGYLPGLHPEFQVSTVSEGYSASILSALAAESKLPFKVDIDNALSVELILVGLMAIAWDCRTRGGMGIRFREGTKQWRGIALSAVINLRAAWEEGIAHAQPSIESRDMRDTFSISVISVLSDIPMLQVAAGATSICGSTIGPRQYKDAQRRLRIWGKTDNAWTCRWQSARYLRQGLFADWGIYSPWAVYLTVLVLWAYTTTRSSDPLPHPKPDNSPAHRQTQATKLLDDILTSAQPAESGEENSGLSEMIVCAVEKLSALGEIERESAGILGRLIGRTRGSISL